MDSVMIPNNERVIFDYLKYDCGHSTLVEIKSIMLHESGRISVLADHMNDAGFTYSSTHHFSILTLLGFVYSKI